MSHPSEQSGLELRETSAKGCGVYALRDFAAGERLLAESPLVECLVQDARGTVQPAAAVEQLSSETRADFFALCQNPQYGAERTARGIWLSNAYPTDDAPEAKSAVFRVCCRFNHACQPSAYQHWNERTRRMTVHAVTAIRSGEEVTVSCMLAAPSITSSHLPRLASEHRASALTSEPLRRQTSATARARRARRGRRRCSPTLALRAAARCAR